MSRREGTAGLGEEQLGCCGLPNIACLAPHSDVMRRLLRRGKCERVMASHRGGLHQRVGRCQGGGLGDAPSKSCVLAPLTRDVPASPPKKVRTGGCGRPAKIPSGMGPGAIFRRAPGSLTRSSTRVCLCGPREGQERKGHARALPSGSPSPWSRRAQVALKAPACGSCGVWGRSWASTSAGNRY